jgi:hypothetical protein
MPAQVNDEPTPKRLAGQAGAGAARHKRYLMFSRVMHERLHVCLVARHNHTEWLDLKNAGIGAVQGPRQVVKVEFPLDEALQIIADAFALLLVHGLDSPRGLFLGFELFPPQSFLPVAFGDAQVVRLSGRVGSDPPVVSEAAVTDHNIAHPQVEQAIERR